MPAAELVLVGGGGRGRGGPDAARGELQDLEFTAVDGGGQFRREATCGPRLLV